MDFETRNPEELWQYYQTGCTLLTRSGRFFRQLVRPAFSHVYFQKALPLLHEYSRANRGASDLPLGFGEQMEACSLNARDLLHLDYAICLGYSTGQGSASPTNGREDILHWPGPDIHQGGFILADFFVSPTTEARTEEDENPEEGNPPPSFDL